MKVALLSDCYPPRLGGIESQVRDLGRRLAEAGHEVHVFTATVGSDGQHGRVVEADGPVTVHRHTIRTPFGLPVNPLAPRRIRGELGDVDVAHVHMGVISPFASDMARLALDLRIPTVVTWHCVLEPLAQRGYAVSGLIPRLAQGGAVLTAVSGMAAARVSAVAGGARVSLLPNGIDPARWQPPRGPSTHAGIRIVSALRFAPRKRVPALIRMLRAVRARVPADVALTATLFGDGALLPPARRLVRDSPWITLAGRVARAELAAAYAASDLYLSPVRLEAFGVAALEARTAGLPVVAVAGSGVCDFVTDGVEGLLADDDAGLVDAVARLATDSILRQGIAAHNRTTPPEQAWPRVVGEVEAVYERARTVMGERMRAG
ncbi:MAG: glycosyltransferase family 4 protein [Dermatophilaceae bacterium]